MKEDQRRNEDDQLRPNTTNENLREASGGRESDLNNLSEGDRDNTGSARTGTDETEGVSYNPNDMSATRSGGTTDMDDQTQGGAGLNTGARKGIGSHLTPKTGVTGSDYDGQNRTS